MVNKNISRSKSYYSVAPHTSSTKRKRIKWSFIAIAVATLYFHPGGGGVYKKGGLQFTTPIRVTLQLLHTTTTLSPGVLLTWSTLDVVILISF